MRIFLSWNRVDRILLIEIIFQVFMLLAIDTIIDDTYFDAFASILGSQREYIDIDTGSAWSDSIIGYSLPAVEQPPLILS